MDLKISPSSRIRFLSANEATGLSQQVRKRNVFARHSWENNFYVQRAKALADHTVIEIYLPGDPKDIIEKGQRIAEILEKTAVLSSTLVLKKRQLQRKLGVSTKLGTEIDFIIGPEYRYLSSRAIPALKVQGITIDGRFCSRFSRCGFVNLVNFVQSKGNMPARVLAALEWLFDSRIEPRLDASVVKTSIALESLLIFSESEALAQSLSERAAFILTYDPQNREQISRIIKRFYAARSGIVHGSRKQAKKLTPDLLEAVDRIAILLLLKISANSHQWPSTEALRTWCESQRWGNPTNDVKTPFPGLYLRNALLLIKVE